MKQLAPEEHRLDGDWIIDDTGVRGDPVSRRIDDLLQHTLQHVAEASGGWDCLYLDPNDGRYWELTYPRSEMQGGGPKRLSVIGSAEAEAKYGPLSSAP